MISDRLQWWWLMIENFKSDLAFSCILILVKSHSCWLWIVHDCATSLWFVMKVILMFSHSPPHGLFWQLPLQLWQRKPGARRNPHRHETAEAKPHEVEESEASDSFDPKLAPLFLFELRWFVIRFHTSYSISFSSFMSNLMVYRFIYLHIHGGTSWSTTSTTTGRLFTVQAPADLGLQQE